MTIYNLYIFDRNGILLYYGEWSRIKHSGMSKEEEAKLMYGMLFSIKSFLTKISPLDMKKDFFYFKTSKYSLNCMETPTGLKFIMNTDINANNVREVLKQIYSQIYVEYIVKNPVCSLKDPIKSELFKEKLDDFVKLCPIHNTKPL